MKTSLFSDVFYDLSINMKSILALFSDYIYNLTVVISLEIALP